MIRAYVIILLMIPVLLFWHRPALAEIIQQTSIGGNAYQVSTGIAQSVSPCSGPSNRCSTAYATCNLSITYTSGLTFMLPANSDEEVCKFIKHPPPSISLPTPLGSCPTACA